MKLSLDLFKNALLIKDDFFIVEIIHCLHRIASIGSSCAGRRLLFAFTRMFVTTGGYLIENLALDPHVIVDGRCRRTVPDDRVNWSRVVPLNPQRGSYRSIVHERVNAFRKLAIHSLERE